MTDFDFLADFSALHELIQIIYQGPHKFIVLSNVEDSAWTIHLALTSAARWWKGRWTESDLNDFVGHKATAEQAETLAAGLASSIAKGEAHVGNWSSEKGAEIHLALGPTSKKPVLVPLTEMEPAEALRFATSTFTTIASYAQERKCKLYPSPYESAGPSILDEPARTSHTSASKPASKAAPSASNAAASSSKTEKAAKPLAPEPTITEKKAQDRIKQLEAELAKEKRKAPPIEARQSENNLLKSRAKGAAPAARAVKGASLANPNKKARKYQELEFEDD